jgi:hypothetical protein
VRPHDNALRHPGDASPFAATVFAHWAAGQSWRVNMITGICRGTLAWWSSIWGNSPAA